MHKSLEATLADGLQQTTDHMDRVGANEGYLVIFDHTPDKPWEEKCFGREEQTEGREGKYRIGVWGM